MTTVIIGGGQAGVQVADSLRAGGYGEEITMVADEAPWPYQRPPLSKELMNAAGAIKPLPLRPEMFYCDNDINLVRGTAATDIDRRRQTVRLADGQQLSYSQLVMATGARVRPLGIAGADLPGVFGLRTLEDAKRLESAIRPGAKVVIVGAGFIGLECASGLRALGCDIIILESGSRAMKRTSSPMMSEWFAEAHRSTGIDLKFEERIARIDTTPGGQQLVALSTLGNRYEADVVVCGNGVMANDTLGAKAGLDVDDGILVDSSLRTSDPKIVAVGDCARFPSVHTGTRARLESVQNATAQGRHAASTILGGTDAYRAVPWFWSVQGKNKLQIAGIVGGNDRRIMVGQPDEGKFSVMNFQRNILTSVESVNQPAVHMAARRALEHAILVTYDQAVQADFSLVTATKAQQASAA